MSSSVGRSPGPRPVVSTAPVSTRRAVPPPTAQTTAAPPRTAAPVRNPNLSDFTQSDARRADIARQARENPSCYASMVSPVNTVLRLLRVDISPTSHRSVSDNLQQVNRGTIPHSEAHNREARTFANDMVQSYRRGNFVQGKVEELGVMVNLLAGVGMRTLEAGQSAGVPLADDVARLICGPSPQRAP